MWSQSTILSLPFFGYGVEYWPETCFCSMLRCPSDVYLFILWILNFIALLFYPIGRVFVNSFWSYGQKHVL